jgi:hypothetical protein
MKSLIRKILKEFESDWVSEVKPMSMGNDYVIDEDLEYWGVSDADSDEYELGSFG